VSLTNVRLLSADAMECLFFGQLSSHHRLRDAEPFRSAVWDLLALFLALSGIYTLGGHVSLREHSATRYHSFLELDTTVEACQFQTQGPSSRARDHETDATCIGDASLGTWSQSPLIGRVLAVSVGSRLFLRLAGLSQPSPNKSVVASLSKLLDRHCTQLGQG